MLNSKGSSNKVESLFKSLQIEVDSLFKSLKHEVESLLKSLPNKVESLFKSLHKIFPRISKNSWILKSKESRAQNTRRKSRKVKVVHSSSN